MESVIIYDEFNQPWRIYEDDRQWPEAKKNVEENEGRDVFWPMVKLMEGRGYGWWTAFKRIADLEKELEQMGIPDPGKYRLIQVDHQYTPDELRKLLQSFGGYLANLYAIEAKLLAQKLALEKGMKTGLQVAMVRIENKKSTVKDREGEVLSENELLLNTRRLEIDTGSAYELASGWRKSYESAYNAASRMISLMIGEAQHLGGNG